MKKLFSFDWVLVLAVLVLLIFGLAMIGSTAPELFRHQLLFSFFGLILFFLFGRIDYHFYEKLSLWFFIGSLFFLMTPFLFGTVARGSLRWVQIGSLGFQPSELVKPFLIIFIASRQTFFQGAFLGLPILLIFLQPDLGGALVMFLAWLGVIFATGISWRFFVLGFAALILFFPLGWGILEDYQQQRIYSFLNPSSDPLGAGYNLIQAKVGVGSGQFLGRGWGRGTQSHLEFLPERHTDFIFASLAEELGFLGAAVLIFVFALLLWRILKAAQEAPDFFGRLIALGIFTILTVQILINIGMNLGMIPITGLTLPLISYGGSSLVATMISLGIVVNIAVIGHTRQTIEIR